MEKRLCPICGNDGKQKLFSQSFSGFSEKNLLSFYDVVSCAKCNFCFADCIPGQNEFDVYYRELSKYENYSEELIESPYDINRFDIMVSYLKAFLTDTQDHIVEVGCATGLLLSRIKKQGFNDVTGIDPSPSCAETAKKYYGINVVTSPISSINLPPGSVDFLILVGVLEHIRDLDSSLHKLRDLLSENGKFYIAVPDASQYHKGEDAPFQEFSVEHINYFGPGSLTNLMKKNGFNVVDIAQSIIEVHHKTFTPLLQAVFSKDIDIISQPIFTPDIETKNNLISYIDICTKKENIIKSNIEKLVNEGKPIIIWGTGAQTLRLLESSKLQEAKIEAFVDSNPKYQGKKLNGITVISPELLKNRKESILISTRAYQNEIERQIREDLKINNEIIKLF